MRHVAHRHDAWFCMMLLCCVVACGREGFETTITGEPFELQLNKQQLDLKVGDAFQLQVFAPNAQPGSVSYMSEDAQIAAVSSDGLVSAVGEGETVIAAMVMVGDGSATVVAEYEVAVAARAIDVVQVVGSRTVVSYTSGLDVLTPVDRLWDGDTSDGYQGKAAGEVTQMWVELDLGETLMIERAALFGDIEGVWTSNVWSLRVRSSADAPWVGVFDNHGCASNAWFSESVASTARFVRVEIYGGSEGVEARELEIWGAPTDGHWDQ